MATIRRIRRPPWAGLDGRHHRNTHLIFQNVADQTRALQELMAEGHPVTREDVAVLSPYMTGHIKRFRDYVLDLTATPQPLESVLAF
jgi:hypothetical protein